MPERPIETLEPADGGGQFVHVVDDEPSLRHLLAFHIAREGHRVVEAATAAEALASAQRQPPDLVLLDLQLPEADALELLAALRRRLPDVPVIALASPDEPAKGIEALRGGAHDLLEKPFDVARLGIAVRNALRVSRLARQVDALRRELLACHSSVTTLNHRHSSAWIGHDGIWIVCFYFGTIGAVAQAELPWRQQLVGY